MYPQILDPPEKFSFKNARLYRNTNDSQFVLAVEIKPRELAQVKKLIYLQSRLSTGFVMSGDYVTLYNGRLGFIYKDSFVNNHVLIK